MNRKDIKNLGNTEEAVSQDRTGVFLIYASLIGIIAITFAILVEQNMRHYHTSLLEAICGTGASLGAATVCVLLRLGLSSLLIHRT